MTAMRRESDDVIEALDLCREIAGRLALLMSMVALVGAWTIQFTHRPIFSLDQQHLFLDSLALAAIGTGLLLNALLERTRQ